MWKKARKKPVEIEFREPEPNCWAYRRYDSNKIFEDSHPIGTRDQESIHVEKIQTLEGIHYAVPGIDWVIKGVKGELYPIKKDIFEKTYDILG